MGPVIICGTAGLFSREAYFYSLPAVWGEWRADPS